MPTSSEPMDAIARANERAYEKLSYFRSVINRYESSRENKKEGNASKAVSVQAQKTKK